MDALSDHIVQEHSCIGHIAALYVESNVYLCLPHLVEERTSNIIIVFDALDAVLSMCLLEVSLGYGG